MVGELAGDALSFLAIASCGLFGRILPYWASQSDTTSDTSVATGDWESTNLLDRIRREEKEIRYSMYRDREREVLRERYHAKIL